MTTIGLSYSLVKRSTKCAPALGQYRVAGRICKHIDGELKSHHFIRSDLCSSAEQANELMVEKAKNFIRHAQD